MCLRDIATERRKVNNERHQKEADGLLSDAYDLLSTALTHREASQTNSTEICLTQVESSK